MVVTGQEGSHQQCVSSAIPLSIRRSPSAGMFVVPVRTSCKGVFSLRGDLRLESVIKALLMSPVGYI